MTFEEILSLFPSTKRKQFASGYWVICQGHDDHSPSLNIRRGEKRAFLDCRVCQDEEKICSAVGIETEDLWYAPLEKTLTEFVPRGKRISDVYDYTDEHGELLYQKVRYFPKKPEPGFRIRRPDGKDGWIWKLDEARRVPYNLPELLRSEFVIIVEGEKAADRLIEIGLCATCAPFGAGKWANALTPHFKGKDCVILTDNDEPGKLHGEMVAGKLSGVASAVKVVLLEGLPEGGDVFDWFQKGYEGEELCEIVERAEKWQAVKAETNGHKENGHHPESVLRIISIASVEKEEVEFLWFPRIAIGKITLIEGDPGLGKSWMLGAIATGISRGKGLPGLETREPSNVLMFSAEDGLGDTVRPRLELMGADLNKVFVLDDHLILDEQGMTLFHEAVIQFKPAIITLDPLVAYLSAEMDINRANETRSIMKQLARIAQQERCAIVALRHLTKGGSKALYRGYGSIDLTAAARSVLLLGEDPDTRKRGLVQIKNNIGPLADPVGYELRYPDGFFWSAECNITSDQILSQLDGEDQALKKDAKEILQTILYLGPMHAKEVESEAKRAGICMKTFQRAKVSLKIASKKRGNEWFWMLPGDEVEFYENK